MQLTKSKIFLYLCLSFALGVLAASFTEVPVLALYAAVIISITSISVFWRDKKLIVAGFCVIFMVLGIWRYQSVSDEKSFIARYNDSKENIIFQGIVSEEPDVKIKDTQYVIQVKSLKLKVQSFGVSSQADGETTFPDYKFGKDLGKVLATLPHYPAYEYGDLIELEGRLKTPAEFDSFSYKDYLAKDGIYSVMYLPKTKLIASEKGGAVYGEIFKIKKAFSEKIKAVLPEPESSFLAGLLLGERSGLSQKLKGDFAATGTSHILAVSGFNVTIIAAILLEIALLIGFSRNQSFWISLFAILFFVIMVGAPASAIRAGIMAGLLMAAMRAGRLSAASTAIVFAAVLMMAFNPKVLRFDAGFQLSFLAVMGLLWIYPILDGYLGKISDFLKIKSMFLLTVSAEITVLPVLAYNFGSLSIVAPLANVLILSSVPLAMGLGFLAGALGFIWMELAKIAGYFAWLTLAYQIKTIEFLASLSWAAADIGSFGRKIDTGFFVLYYLILASAVLSCRDKKERLVSF